MPTRPLPTTRIDYDPTLNDPDNDCHLKRFIDLDFAGETGEEIWDMIVDSLKEYLGERAYRYLKRCTFNSRDPVNDTMTITAPWMPKNPDDMNKLLDNLLESARMNGFYVRGFNVLTMMTEEKAETEVATHEADWAGQWRIRSGKVAVLGPDQPEWTIEGLLAKNSGLLLSGLPHGTKSLMMLLAALQCVTTKIVWGKFRVPDTVRNVVFVETEDSEHMVRRRIKAFCKGLGIDCPPPGFHVVTPGPFDLLRNGEDILSEVIKKTHADLLILSTLQGLINGSDWKEQKDMAPVNAIMVRLQRNYCSTVLITHSPWNEKRAAGSVTQAANYSSLMHFVKAETEEETVITAKLDSKDTSGDSTFCLKLDIEKTLWPDGTITTQVRNVQPVERKMGRPTEYDEDRKLTVLALRKEGKSIREISGIMNIPKSVVAKWAGKGTKK